MFVDYLIVFVIIAEGILRLNSLSESLNTGPAHLEDRGQGPWQPALGPPHPAWALQGQSSASAPRGGWLQENQMASGSAFPLPFSCWVCGPQG